jgi:tetratricopeptide (TPR) repeat protein
MKTMDFSYFIERYISGEMNEKELLWFKKELEGNEKLRQEVELRRKTNTILQRQDILQLRGKLQEIEFNRARRAKVKVLGKATMKYAAIIAVLIVAAGGILISTGTRLTGDQVVERYYTLYEPATTVRSLQSFDDYTSASGTGYFQKAMDYYNMHDYRNAGLLFSKVLEDDPRYIESVFLGGVSNFEQKDYPEAGRSFRTVISDNNNTYIEDAEWFLSMCYLKTGEKDKARECLNTIKNSKSIYRKDASTILRKLK